MAAAGVEAAAAAVVEAVAAVAAAAKSAADPAAAVEPLLNRMEEEAGAEAAAGWGMEVPDEAAVPVAAAVRPDADAAGADPSVSIYDSSGWWVIPNAV